MYAVTAKKILTWLEVIVNDRGLNFVEVLES